MKIAAVREEGDRHGFNVGPNKFYEAKRVAAGLPPEEPAAPPPVPTPTERRGRAKAAATTSAAEMFAEVRRVMDGRERYYGALKAIEALLASSFADGGKDKQGRGR